MNPGCLWLAESVHSSFSVFNRMRGVGAATDSELFTDLGLDSLYYTTLLNEVCERYGVTIPERLFRSIRTIRDITSVIQAKTAPA